MSQSNDHFSVGHVVGGVLNRSDKDTSAAAVAIHSSLFDGAIAATKVVVVCLLLSLPFSLSVVHGFLVAIAVYGSNKLVDDEDAVNCPDRAAFVERHRRGLTILTVGSYLLSLGLAAVEGVASFGLVLLPGIAAVLYSVEWVPNDGGTRLKDVLFVNTVLVAAAWAIPLTFLPLTYADKVPGLASLTIFGFFFLQTVVAGEVMNARDVAGDRREGVSTLSTRFGVGGARRALYGIDALTVGLLVAATVTGVLGTAQLLALLPAVGFSLAVTAMVGRDIDLSRLATARNAEYPLMLAGVLLIL
ncbi:UbiA family prenyltransferase [Haloarchaeobius sp. DFWS5]|uniref:UbiA family prenyltransferase n=1 Tax=Haloarchaeobius sp. DFWS5 TaxID=3446114 RepID=UPI003EB725E5